MHDVCTLAWSLARLQLAPPQELVGELLGHALPQLAACDAPALAALVWALGRLRAAPGDGDLAALEQASLQLLPSAGIPELVSLAGGLHAMAGRPPSAAWQAACLRELHARCLSCGHELECAQLAALLDELGVPGLAAGAALADASLARAQAGVAVAFEPGCR